MTEHCIKIEIPVFDEDSILEIKALGDRLDALLDESEVGEFDGDEYSENGATLYLYGPDADALFAAIESSLRMVKFPSGAYALLRYGPPNDETVKAMKVSLA